MKNIRMMALALLAACICMPGCTRHETAVQGSGEEAQERVHETAVQGSGEEAQESVHETTESERSGNSIYYWKSGWSENEEEKWDLDFLAQHKIGRVYMRFFDIVDDAEHGVIPSAIIYAREHHIAKANVEIVPTVFITQEAMGWIKNRPTEMAYKIQSYIDGMCRDMKLETLSEIQLDCDWTATTRDAFFQLCQELRERLQKNGIRLTSTIRLHQLTQPTPPVDGGVLMLYNVGSLKNPTARNSIIDASIVETYLKRAPQYALHLDVAYPAFAWKVVFVDGKFKKLRKIGDDYRNDGEFVREEYSDYDEVMRTKQLVEKYLDGKPHRNIVYHLDRKQLSRYTDTQIDSIYE